MNTFHSIQYVSGLPEVTANASITVKVDKRLRRILFLHTTQTLAVIHFEDITGLSMNFQNNSSNMADVTASEKHHASVITIAFTHHNLPHHVLLKAKGKTQDLHRLIEILIAEKKPAGFNRQLLLQTPVKADKPKEKEQKIGALFFILVALVILAIVITSKYMK